MQQPVRLLVVDLDNMSVITSLQIDFPHGGFVTRMEIIFT